MLAGMHLERMSCRLERDGALVHHFDANQGIVVDINILAVSCICKLDGTRNSLAVTRRTGGAYPRVVEIHEKFR